MHECEFCKQSFITQDELDKHTKASLERAKKMGGKFALLAKAMEGDNEAAEMLAQLIKAGIVGPGFDNTPSEN